MPTRNERLAEHYIAQTGIVAVQIDRINLASFKATWSPVVTLAPPPTSRRIFCCAAANDAAHLVARLSQEIGSASDFPAATAALHRIAIAEGVGITPHEIVADRARAVVAEVNERFDLMRKNYKIRHINREFKALRAKGAVTNYAEFVHGKKAEMLTALARAV
ncbi:hypothetical protein OCAR_5571 [Afipia carboxidovorans OM5]|uniref:Uncharacterized protein n=1 Tax=Afipia carboxidovorans (strain ATCC 49405 / DSM 1227 / KCTC 32145 / OM5) TaxID=504832 RepID=B6JED7_AFIC5|nr:hypothetical protein [Afipia carboxidovorans]ACI92702.1 hypothetical protein OCAR_5571 [Afipia carboxidovorans OM5]AEI03545.1 hypothetical protein OCA4_c24250 [Afipia carboxidovorans OM4]AEI07122.1 hypothetical protein OCA5_c24260 [Afipia carboxidovorans OM5]BEV44699.1 hypothetical protein CRBSH125_08820 [Afipia carboxidovorans]